MQDTWTIKRLTINPGLRIEWFSAGMRASRSRRRTVRAGAVLPRRARPAEVGPRLRAAHGGRVRPLRQRPHRHQGQLQQVSSSVRRRPGRGLFARRAPQRTPQLARLRAERGRHRVLGRGGSDQQRRHRAGSRDRPEPRGRHVRDGPQQHARRSRPPVQLGDHDRRPASAEPARRGGRDDVQAAHPRNSDDRPLVHHHGGLHPVRGDDAGADLAGPGCGRGARRERADHGLQPERGEEQRVRPGAGRPERNQDRSLYTGFETSFSARLPGRRDDVRQLDGGEEHVSVFCENNDNPNGPTTARSVSGAQRRARRALLRSARLQHAVPARVQAGRQLHAAARRRHRRGRCRASAAWSASSPGR